MKTIVRLHLLLCAVGLCVYMRGYVLQEPFLHQTTWDCESNSSAKDPWFNERFNKSVKLFMSPNDRLPERTFQWWRRMRGEKGNFSVYKVAVSEAFQVLPHSPNVLEPTPRSCRSCAVVGNSVSLRGSRYGPLINFQDLVFRINGGRIKGFEADVGNKTTHHIMFPESMQHLDNTTRLVMFPFKTADIRWIGKAISTGYYGTPRFRAKVRANKDLAMVVNPVFMQYVHEAWLEKKGHYPSTGFMTLVLAMHLCDELHVFGFGADENGDWNHYWSLNAWKLIKTGGHPGAFEYQTIEKLGEHRIIRFYRGWGPHALHLMNKESKV
ncbi:CMP-N-acetylneuraminate-beta-galactosamide-alpha-2,3-sialyltransferase 1 isoform X1 [Labrus bergylta]|uniref:CMP-N-acetylneuraminate-beta-galactosamide- alpha-2,3-sialyltransferase 1 isoform X1 n=1 Tax=Labrus bergylta TaxID=56723 RepID=UPI003313CE09